MIQAAIIGLIGTVIAAFIMKAHVETNDPISVVDVIQSTDAARNVIQTIDTTKIDSFTELRTFSISGGKISQKNLNILEEKLNLKFDQRSNNIIIHIDHTGIIRKIPFSKSRYGYTGGKIQITVNNIICPLLSDLMIQAVGSPGLAEESVANFVKQEMTSILSKNMNQIADTILKCIK